MADIGTTKFSRTRRADDAARLRLISEAKQRIIGARARR